MKGTRIPVYQIVRMLANGDTAEDLLREYPSLSVTMSGKASSTPLTWLKSRSRRSNLPAVRSDGRTHVPTTCHRLVCRRTEVIPEHVTHTMCTVSSVLWAGETVWTIGIPYSVLLYAPLPVVATGLIRDPIRSRVKNCRNDWLLGFMIYYVASLKANYAAPRTWRAGRGLWVRRIEAYG